MRLGSFHLFINLSTCDLIKNKISANCSNRDCKSGNIAPTWQGPGCRTQATAYVSPQKDGDQRTKDQRHHQQGGADT